MIEKCNKNRIIGILVILKNHDHWHFNSPRESVSDPPPHTAVGIRISRNSNALFAGTDPHPLDAASAC